MWSCPDIPNFRSLSALSDTFLSASWSVYGASSCELTSGSKILSRKDFRVCAAPTILTAEMVTGSVELLPICAGQHCQRLSPYTKPCPGDNCSLIGTYQLSQSLCGLLLCMALPLECLLFARALYCGIGLAPQGLEDLREISAVCLLESGVSTGKWCILASSPVSTGAAMVWLDVVFYWGRGVPAGHVNAAGEVKVTCDIPIGP